MPPSKSKAGRSFLGCLDADFIAVGATIFTDRRAALAAADVVWRVRKPPLEEVEWLKSGTVHLSFLDPFRETELVRQLAERGVSAISLEMLPRTTRAQKMDALTSQANLAGDVAVVLAADHATRRAFASPNNMRVRRYRR